MSWTGISLIEKEKAFRSAAGPESDVWEGREKRTAYFRTWPFVSGMRMKVISVITAPASKY